MGARELPRYDRTADGELALTADLLGHIRPRLCMWARRCDDGSIAWLSAGFADLFGRDPEEFVGRNDLVELVHPDDRDQFLGGAEDIADRVLLWRVLRPDGAVRWARSQVVATIEMPDGEHHWIGVIEDVTDDVAERRHRREMEATFAELKFALNDADAADLDEALDHGLRLLGELVGADRSYLFGLHGEGLLSNTHEWCADGVEPAIGMLQSLPASEFRWAMDRLAVGPQKLSVAELPAEAGELRPVLEAQGIRSLVLVPTLLRGEVTGFVGFDSVIDVRQWHEGDVEILERFARSVQSALDRADAQRRSRESLAELVSAREAAESASAAKSRLLSRVSHELRTPVSVVVSSAELLSRSELGPSDRGHVERILRSAREQLAMIDDLLEVARSDHRDARTVQLVDVGDVARNLLELAAGQSDVTTELVVGGDPSIAADPELVRRVVANLLSNAVKYNRPHGLVVVRVDEVDHGVVLEVADTGPGIDTDRFDQLWEPFERLGAETGLVAGTGLGLAIVAHALDELGGSVEVESSGEGSVFRVFLPDRDENGGASPEASLLLVDDHDAVRTMMDTLLRQVGGFHDIRHASTCTDAMAEVARDRPSVVLLDRHLPDGLGETLIAQVRGLPGASTLPVVVLSADATEAARQRSLEAGADAYVVKPAAVPELVDLVRSLVTR